MPDIIQLLPDSVANQIAAGEVVQRPASVVKELVENSIDAGSTKIQVIIKDAGRTLVQVIDNGCGMSDSDARMCFERHATSKIRKAADLFDISTMGFRGEAMASIAAIATVELKTKKIDDNLGTFIRISGSVTEKQEPVSCPNGTNISVKNLFFNVPARRKFLKSNSTELKHIMEDFQRVALGFPEIEMHLVHNDVELYNLPASKIYNRIINVLGKHAAQNLLPVQSQTSIANIRGYIGKPENARKSAGEQFFFVNHRFMKHPYFYRAVVMAYDNIMGPGLMPSFFIYFDVDPSTIDINIHPTKTEIKFEHEKELWPIIVSTVKEGLGKHNIVPSIDFSIDATVEIPVYRKDTPIQPPTIKVNPNYNPFGQNNNNKNSSGSNYHKNGIDTNWEKLYQNFNNPAETPDIFEPAPEQLKIDLPSIGITNRFFQIKGRYILTTVKSGIMLIDQKRAHERILFDEYIYKIGPQSGAGQKLLYPATIQLSAVDAELFKTTIPEINKLGFEIDEFGANTFVVNMVPAEFPDKDINDWINDILDNIKENGQEFIEALRENIVKTLAKFLSIPYGKQLSQQEMANINDRLFISQMPNIAPDGRTIVSIINIEEIEKKFK